MLKRAALSALVLGVALAAPGCDSTGPAAHRAIGMRVPPGFAPDAFAGVGRREFWLLGTAPCSAGRCRALVHTTDGGRSSVEAGAPPLPVEGTTPSLTFANRRDGFAFVPDSRNPLYATHDGGATWHRQPVDAVLVLATTPTTVYAVTARCTSRRCGHYRLQTAHASSSAWRPRLLPFAPGGALASLAARGSNVWLLGTPRGTTSPYDVLARSTDSAKTFSSGTGPCYSDLGGLLSPTSGNAVWAVCPTGMSAGALLSTDGGRTFTQLYTPQLVNSARLTPASARTAVLFGNGAGSRLLRTTDGGRSWHPSRVPRTPTAVSWLGFTDARVGYALVQTGWDAARKVERQALWRTADSGAYWAPVRIR